MKKSFVLLLFLILTVQVFSESLHGSIKGFPKKAPEIKNLITDEGKHFNLSDYKGKILIVTYGYTQCPFVCPTITAFLKQIETELNEKGYKDKYKIIFISVDPKDDTVQRLHKYKTEKGFNEFIFLTGNSKDLKKVWKNYNVYIKDKGIMEMKHNGYVMKHRMINHTAKVTIIDKKGYIREEFLGMYLPTDKIIQDVIFLIKEK